MEGFKAGVGVYRDQNSSLLRGVIWCDLQGGSLAWQQWGPDGLEGSSLGRPVTGPWCWGRAGGGSHWGQAAGGSCKSGF